MNLKRRMNEEERGGAARREWGKEKITHDQLPRSLLISSHLPLQLRSTFEQRTCFTRRSRRVFFRVSKLVLEVVSSFRLLLWSEEPTNETAEEVSAKTFLGWEKSGREQRRRRNEQRSCLEKQRCWEDPDLGSDPGD